MSFSRRRILKAASYFMTGAVVVNAKRGITVTTPTSSQTTTATQTSSIAQRFVLSPPTWREKILNSDGTINWTEYINVANNYDRQDIIDYRFGPDYAFYHPNPENIPKLWGPTTNGFIGNDDDDIRADRCADNSDWYAMSGQLLFSPDATAKAEYKPGVARARNGSIYLFDDQSPEYSFDMRVQWESVCENYYSSNPDDAVKQQSWKDAAGGSIPAPPIATIRTKCAGGVTGFLIFKNGLIGATGTGNDGYAGTNGSDLPYPFLKLQAGKVPTAAAVTLGNEFLLVTVWDTIKRRGQVAVIAIKGRVLASQKVFRWGFPSWPTVESIKLLGYVDLPFAAPTGIQTSFDHVTDFGRTHGENKNLDLNSQAERNTWYNWSGSRYKRTARSGYAVVISRAENKAAFIDLQPLLQYYRKMYFTTQANYDQTKNDGKKAEQWPLAFGNAPEQKPQVVQTISVTKPTAVAAGLPYFPFFWRDDHELFQQNAYIATMDGELRMYKVGNLMTTNSGGTIGAPFKIVKIGKNPTNIDYGRGGDVGNDMFINCRGDKSVYYLYYDGSIHASFRDARLQDPVYVAVSNNRRGDYNCGLLTVMDFRGRQVVNYRYENNESDPPLTPVGNPPGSSVFEYGYATSVPGYPFMFTLAEVI